MRRYAYKLSAVLAATVTCCLMLVACAPQNAIDFEVQYEYNYNRFDVDKNYPAVGLLRSQHVFDGYCTANGLETIVYDDDFFIDKYALVIELPTSDSSIKYSVKYVQWVDDNSLLVTVDKTSEGDGATGVGTAYIFVAVAAIYEIPDESSVTVNLR